MTLPITLAVDASTYVGTVAVWRGNARVAEDKVKEALHEMVAIVKAIGRSMEAEHLRMDGHILTRLSSMSFGSGFGHSKSKSIMEYKVIQGLAEVSSDRSIFRQWHHKFRSAIGQSRTWSS